jgi:protein phosphatase-4 regulatory subunit 3
VNYKEVIPIHNTELLKKIHLTYRIQYIKDILVPVPSLFDENMSALGSYLLFSKIEIVELIQQDSRFIEELFNKLTDDEISDDKRKEALCLLRELVNFSQSLQNENRIIFIKSLSSQGLLQSLEQLMNIDELEIRSVIVDIICCIVECTPSLVRDYLCKEGNTLDEDSMLLNMLIEMLLSSAENEMGVILMQLIRIFLILKIWVLEQIKWRSQSFLVSSTVIVCTS